MGSTKYALEGDNSKVLIYKVLSKNYALKQGELIGALVERRKDLRGKSRVESGSKWAKLVFGRMVRNKQKLFVIPFEVKLKDNTIMPVEKMVFNREEFLEMVRVVDREMKRQKNNGS